MMNYDDENREYEYVRNGSDMNDDTYHFDVKTREINILRVG